MVSMVSMKINEIELIIFDLDGTLVDAYDAIIKSFNYAMQGLGYPPQDDPVIRRAVGWGDENLLRPFINSKDFKKALLLYRRHHKKAILKYSHLFPKVKTVLQRLKRRGYKLAIASNRPTRFSRMLIRHLGLDEYFGFVLCKDALRYGKPHPQILNKIMQRFSLKPKQTVYVGDMHIDAQAGRRAGVLTLIVISGSSTRSEIRREKPYRIINNIAEILKLFIR